MKKSLTPSATLCEVFQAGLKALAWESSTHGVTGPSVILTSIGRGIDGNKKIKGRKEHIVVDTLRLPMSVTVHPANAYDSIGAEEVF